MQCMITDPMDMCYDISQCNVPVRRRTVNKKKSAVTVPANLGRCGMPQFFQRQQYEYVFSYRDGRVQRLTGQTASWISNGIQATEIL